MRLSNKIYRKAHENYLVIWIKASKTNLLSKLSK